MKVKEAMHKGVDWVSPDTPVIELAKLMREHGIGAIPTLQLRPPAMPRSSAGHAHKAPQPRRTPYVCERNRRAR
jgi:hypothetical protein